MLSSEASPACCGAESISNSSAPGRTCSPERTAMRVRKPSTCGWMVVERRDLSEAMYSLVCSTRLLGERDGFDRHRRRAATGTARAAGGAAAPLPAAGSSQTSRQHEKQDDRGDCAQHDGLDADCGVLGEPSETGTREEGMINEGSVIVK